MQKKYSEHPAMFRNNPLGFILAVLLIPVAIGIIILMVWYLKCKSTRLDFIGNDLVLERGLLSKDRTELDVSRIRTVNVYQSFFNRIFGVGRISIYTAGDDPEIDVSGLPNPHDLRELIKAEQDA
ncbi:PH domain-containing protein [Pseudohongiella sp.]|uniref:YdbS-like PH domain-containing protein n=1 Tax=marine sediment metagenome TaxID=412755 RepID=A0A0F9W5N9_9ZZZZ|nr:PH domain-containing protein [Pseudohongiella sp.]HDZ09701.1 PH domain-containing protein [Pseudohongiella sp.]HEA61890.1 PH domain-containing protein [Pseudohongiella sp.]